MKKIFLIVIALIFMTSKSFASITDSASLLTGEEFSKLSSQIQQIEHKHGIKIEIVTQSSIHGKNIKEVSYNLLNRVADLPNAGVNGNFLFLIVMDNRQFYAVADNKLQSRLFDSNSNPRFDESKFISYVKQGDYLNGLTAYLNGIDSALQNNSAVEPSNNFFDPIALIIAVVGGIIIGVMYRSSLIASMSNVRPAIEASEYLNQSSIKITERRDNFLYMNVSRRPKNQGGHGGSGNNSGGGHGGSF